MKSNTNKKMYPSHTAKTNRVSGDSYGSAIKQKYGRMREDQLVKVSRKSVGKPPKSLA